MDVVGRFSFSMSSHIDNLDDILSRYTENNSPHKDPPSCEADISPWKSKDSKLRAAKIAIEVLEMFNISEDNVVTSCNELKKICLCSYTRSKLGELGACSAIIDVMKYNRFSRVIIKNSCEAIASLVIDTPRNVILLAQIDETVSLFENVLQFYMSGNDEDLVETICFTLDNLSSEKVTCEKFGESSKFIEHLIAVGDKYLSNKNIIESISNFILNLSVLYPEKNMYLHDHGVCHLINSALDAYKDSKYITESLCKIISNLSKQEDFTDMFEAIEVSDSIMTVISTHLSSESNVIAALSALTSVHLSSTRSDMSVIINCIETHNTSRVTALLGCEVIRIVSLGKVGRIALHQSGACEVIVKVLSVHIKDDEVVIACCKAVRQFSFGDIHNIIRLHELGITEYVGYAMRRNLKSVAVVMELCTCFDALVVDAHLLHQEHDPNGLRNRNLTVCEVLVKALLRHRNEENFSSVANSLLWKLWSKHLNGDYVENHSQ